MYEIKAFPKILASQKKRTEYATKIYRDIQAREFIQTMQQELGIDFKEAPAGAPETEEELEDTHAVRLQTIYRSCRRRINRNTLAKNKYDLTRS